MAKSTAVGASWRVCAHGQAAWETAVVVFGEINDAQHAAWCEAISVFDEGAKDTRPNERFFPPIGPLRQGLLTRTLFAWMG